MVVPLQLLLLCFAQQSAQVRGPNYWVLVHTGDKAAETRILAQTQYEKVREVAAELGYEAVVEKQVVYLFPVPAWSAGKAQVALTLLADAINDGFGRPLEVGKMPLSVKGHIHRFFKKKAATLGSRGLGKRALETSLSIIKVSRSVDLKFEVDGREVMVPFGGADIANSFSSSEDPPQEPVEAALPPVVDFPDRPELFGLGTESFAVTVSKPTTPGVFAKLVDRVQELLATRRHEQKEQLETMSDAAFDAVFSTQDATALQSGTKIEFSALPQGLQSFLLERARQNPSVFGLTQDSIANLQRTRIWIPEDGLRVFVSFMLDGSLPASDGSPITYSISFEIEEIID